jgi:hypothetical protein
LIVSTVFPPTFFFWTSVTTFPPIFSSLDSHGGETR